MENERYRYSVYSYTKNNDGSLELHSLDSFEKEDEARSFFEKKLSDIKSGISISKCAELNKDIYLGEDLFSSNTVNLEHFESRADFAV